ncbi:hypothetical protein C2W62_03860 [Candidatus Entotheonella serta]|nr:hypothetical protein C2W62_03860 [Candidatus Entotheonella serta]
MSPRQVSRTPLIRGSRYMSDLIYRYLRPRFGLTLIELLVVTMIIGILAAFASPTMKAYFERVRVAKGVSTSHTVQASLASYTTTSDSNQYPGAILSYDELTMIINTNGGQLEATEDEAGMIFRQYTALDTDKDDTWDSYTMSFRVIDVPRQRPGWCIIIQPSGIERCRPQ